MDLTNCILTADALNTQKETVSAIKEAKGDYVLALKKNKKIFYEDVKDYFDDLDILKEIEKEKNGARNLGILKRICLAVLKFVQTYYNLSLNKIRFLLSIDFEKEIENVFKLLNTNDIAKLLEKDA